MTKDEWDVEHKSFAHKTRTLSGCDEVSSNQINSLLSVESSARARDCANIWKQKTEHEAENSNTIQGSSSESAASPQRSTDEICSDQQSNVGHLSR